MSYNLSAEVNNELVEMQKNTQEHIHICRTAGLLTLNPMKRFLIKEAKDIFQTSLNIIEENQNQTYRIKQLVSFNEELVLFILKLSAEYNQKKTKQYINSLNDFWSRLTNINSFKEQAINYWTASDSKEWSQPINQNLCSLNENSIQIALGGIQVRKHEQYIKNLKTTNHNFYIREHSIALKYNNSEVVEKTLREKINYLQNIVANKKQ